MPRTRTGVVWFLQHSTNIPPVTFGAHVGTSPRHNHQKKFWGYRDYHGTTTLAVYNGIRNHAYPSPLSIILVNTSDPFIQAWFCVHWNVYACVVLSCDICVVYISADRWVFKLFILSSGTCKFLNKKQFCNSIFFLKSQLSRNRCAQYFFL